MGRRLGQKTGMRPGCTPDRIVAILDANRPCTMTVDQLVYELAERFGADVTTDTVLRAVIRLRNNGLIETTIELFDDYDYHRRTASTCVYGRPYVTRKRLLAGAA